MSTLDYARPGRRSLIAAVAAGVRAASQAMHDWHRRRLAVRQLQSMSDAQLKDVGLHRSQIEFLVRGLAVAWSRSSHADH
jgi:uncharacterized protein YjiS (DUF1127 family)